MSLTSYMTLPVEQYFVLDPSQIRHIGHNRFMLKVPRINVSVQMEHAGDHRPLLSAPCTMACWSLLT